MSGPGDCFEVAWDLVFRNEIEVPNDGIVRVVHGTPIGKGEENKGQRFWHAWIETEFDVEVPNFDNSITIHTVIDRSNGLDLNLPRALYYNTGRLDERHVFRFTRQEAIDAVIEFGHYGPWLEDWEEVCAL